MNAPATIDADRVQALNRLIREKTGRVDSDTGHVAPTRKNLWLQVPPAKSTDGSVRRTRRPASSVTASRAPVPAAPREGVLAQRIRRLLTLLLSAALLLATAATAVDLLTAGSGVPGQEAPTHAPAIEHAADAAPVTAADIELRNLRSENQRLRERLRALDRKLQSKTH